jgi:Cu(I)/Ag(I) efflux system membrane fusion protein
MNARTWILVLLGAALLGAAGYTLYTSGMNRGMAMATPQPANGRRVLYWHDPMVPGPKFDKPGKSPFMSMQLVPVYADDAGGPGPSGVRIDPGLQQNLGVRTSVAARTRIGQQVEVLGNVAYNERDVALVQARANGYVERLDVRAPLDPVRKGQALAQLYVPDWVASQEEYLAARRLASAAPGLEEAARQRMRLAGMSDAQIDAVQRDGRVHPRLTVTAPISGVISELSAREGMTVMNGAPLFRINGLATVWVVAQVPEGMVASVRPGTSAQVRTAAFPDETFNGKVTALLPEVDPATRTLKARVEVANPQAKLSPGMFARVSFSPSDAREVLAVPSEAVIRTGRRTLVMVTGKDGRFAPVEVETGAEGDGKTEIRKGLAEGDKVVSSGQFLIDSEASLKGVEARTDPVRESAPRANATASMRAHHGEGRVESVGNGEITLSHGPIPSLQWPAMTMAFKAPPSGISPDIKVGDRVVFETRQTPDGFAITSIAKSGGSK